MTTIAPVPGAERALQLDVLRGFALCGILLMNIEAFVGPLNTAMIGLDPALQGADRWVDALIYVLVQGKFFTLFSLLFGAGFALILDRMPAGAGGGWLYLRRLLVLLGIGLLHALFIWSGDILTTYALIGFLLLALFRRTPASRLPKWGLCFYLVPTALTFLFAFVAWTAQFDPQAAAGFQQGMDAAGADYQAQAEAQRAAYGVGGSFAQANAQRAEDLVSMLSYLVFYGPLVLGMFLIGAGLVRSGALLEPAAHLTLFRRLRGWGLGLGLPLALCSFWMQPTLDFGRMDWASATAQSLMSLAGLLLCLGYMASVVLGLQNRRWHAPLAWLAPAGRMALTHYLLQSVICVGLFYGYGLGYFEQLPRAWQPLFVFALFALQVQFSHWWLARFRFGPAEWLWRSLTYLRPQPLRRSPGGSATPAQVR
jgi:uncharacterized protein